MSNVLSKRDQLADNEDARTGVDVLVIDDNFYNMEVVMIMIQEVEAEFKQDKGREVQINISKAYSGDQAV